MTLQMVQVNPILRLTLTRKEIADALGVGVPKVDQLIAANAFPSGLFGGTRLARVEDIAAYIERVIAEQNPGCELAPALPGQRLAVVQPLTT